jgi:hypothetical protein
VGLGTNPLNASNFSGGRSAALSWAQVAAQATGPPPLPQLATQDKHKPRDQTTVTAYKDRVVTVKLKDHGIAQRFRAQSAVKTRENVETAILTQTATRMIRIVAAHQLKSGDIQIFTNTTAEAAQLKANREWLRGLGEHAELIVPTYGVIVHGIPTHSINMKEPATAIQQMLADNHTVVPDAEITYIGWLTKESHLKRASSIVVEFTEPEMANAIIYAGMVWDGQVHQCQLYDRACRIKQCFRCYNYGHIGTQCSAAQVCGYCSEQHETKHCSQKGAEGFAPRCTVCKGVHTAWSNACPARKKEMGRVEQAKQMRNIYWHVPVKETARRSREPNAHIASAGQERQRDRTADHATILTSQQAGIEVMVTQHGDTQPNELSTEQQVAVAESAATAEPVVAAESSQLALAAHNSLAETAIYPIGEIDEEISLGDAEMWLDNLDIDDDNDPDWLCNVPETGPSPLTSMATETRTASGIFKGCKCPSHQDIYENWPKRNANLTISNCMRTCVYCGKDFPKASEVRLHLKSLTYLKRNLEVNRVSNGRNKAPTPSWTPRTSTASPVGRPDQRPRRRILISSASTTPSP